MEAINKLHLEFHSDTGNQSVIKLESVEMYNEIDTNVISDFDAIEILSLLESDIPVDCVYLDDLQKANINEYDIKIYNVEYVKWLEEKLNKLI